MWFLVSLFACGTSSTPVAEQAVAEQGRVTTTVCDSRSHESTVLGQPYLFDLDCAVDWLKTAGCDFALDPNGDGDAIASSSIEDLANDAASCQRGSTCTGCDDADSVDTITACTELAGISYWTESEWADLAHQCPPVEAPEIACAIDGVDFTEEEAACAVQFFTTMDCDSCVDVLDSRTCEDAINNPAECQVGSSCTGCTDGDARANGVTCEEIAAYSYLGPVSSQQLLDHVRANPCDTTCQPQCDGRTCGDDGCGGTCGTCADGATCDTQGQCSAQGCTIEGVYFNALEKECALTFFEGMDCASCDAFLPSRVCEDAINDPAKCQKGSSCTGCTDDDTIDDGVTCDEIAGYAYLGASTAADLLNWVQNDASCGVPDLVVDGVPPSTEQATAILEVANFASWDQLTAEAGIPQDAASNLMTGRPHTTIQGVGDTTAVGQTAMEKLRDYAPNFTPAPSYEDDLTHDEEEEIPDGTGATLETRVNVQTAPPTARAESIQIDIEHPDKSQLEVEIVAPNGARYLLWDFENNPESNHRFDTSWNAGVPINGTWTLKVRDYHAGGLGSLRGWNLHVATP